MILLYTHIWYWWVSDSPRLLARQRELIEKNRTAGLGLSVISLWEVAKKHQLGKLELDRSLTDWIDAALQFPNFELLPITWDIIRDSTSLPNNFRSDPADELIVATARVLDVPLLTVDNKLVDYPHVPILSESLWVRCPQTAEPISRPES